MKENYNIKDLLRADNLTRWHTAPTVRPQSLAEHQWNVCMIATNLALSMGLEDSQVALIQNKALIHDMDELWEGDIPSPHKEALKRTGGSPSVVGLGVGTYIAGPSLACDDGRAVAPEIHHNTMIDDIVRAADRIDAWQWSRKFVLDDSVIKDCHDRMRKFANNSHAELFNVIDKLIDQL